MGIEGKFRVGDAIVIEGTSQDGKVGTILQCVQDEYLVVLEDGVVVFLPEENLAFRH